MFALLALAPAALASAAWASADAPAPAAATPRIVVEPASFDFGTLRPAGEVQKEFVIRNHGRAELVIQSISTDCGCTAALSETKTVRPGGSTAMRVTLHAALGRAVLDAPESWALVTVPQLPVVSLPAPPPTPRPALDNR